MESALLPLALAAALAGAGLLAGRLLRSRRDLGSEADQATYRALHTTALAAPPLRDGLTPVTAGRAARHLRALLGSRAVALTDEDATLAWDGAGEGHAPQAVAHARNALSSGRTVVVGPEVIACTDFDCPVLHAVAVPLSTDDVVVGALVAYADSRPSAGLVRATEQVAAFVSGQLELADLEASRTRVAEAQLRALRAQISPHFVYNSLTAIASFVRTDPERARELLLEFADFTRYSFRRHGDFTTLAEELHSIERYLVLEKARFGDRLQVTLRVAPEVLPVAVPFLSLQPLVENAVRHGLEGKPGPGHVTIVAEDRGNEAVITIEDDGVGMDPEALRRTLAGDADGDGVGVANVDERLRAVYGDEHGLVVETGIGAGTRATLTIPKYRAGVHAS